MIVKDQKFSTNKFPKMTNQKTSISRRSFLKSSALAGGGLMISFSALAKFDLDDKVNKLDLPDQWYELTGYIKITPDNIIKIFNPNPEFGQNVMTCLLYTSDAADERSSVDLGGRRIIK